MKIKDKKVMLLVAGVVLVGGIVLNSLYSKINTTQNNYSSMQSILFNIKDNLLQQKDELLSLQEDIVKLNKVKGESIKIDSAIESIEKEDYSDNTKLNKNIAQLDILNKEIDNIIDIYNNDESMKKDMPISNSIIEIEVLNNFIDTLMQEYNNEYVENFNASLNQFPVNLVVKSEGWFKLDKFSSVG